MCDRPCSSEDLRTHLASEASRADVAEAALQQSVAGCCAQRQALSSLQDRYNNATGELKHTQASLQARAQQVRMIPQEYTATTKEPIGLPHQTPQALNVVRSSTGPGSRF